jgi:ADP-dependent NAD(P)H-hydrate dehydratase / NAD(P)H-hydrate epimerase
MTGEILTTAEMAKADAFAVAHGVPSLTLMENAGRVVAEAIASRFKPCAVTVLCGPGNNGGDGFVVARLLSEDGYTVRVAHDAEPKGDAAAMSEKWKSAREALTPGALDGTKLVIDGLFGAGLSRPLDGAYAQIVEALNDLPVVAIDMPSGVSGDTGQPLGGVYVKAALTVTFFRKKPGHLLMPGRALCGEIVLGDIGIPPQAANTQLHENTSTLWHLPKPKLDSHKYSRGHCVVVSGPAHATGAGRLAARGALRVGSGLVSVASPPDAVAVNAAHLTAIMIKPFEGAAGLSGLLSDKRLNAIVLGPGLGVGRKTHEMVVAALSSGASLVLDADAITSFKDDTEFLFRLLHDRCVLTPHAGEFERLFPGLLDQSASKLEAARAAAKRAGCVVLLKGADTVIAAPSGKAAINANAPPSLATAGAGDVLAGFVGGLLAQGMAAFDAAACGSWLHGEAASRFGPGLIAEDLPEILPEVLRALS